jgi:hypothetical protein
VCVCSNGFRGAAASMATCACIEIDYKPFRLTRYKINNNKFWEELIAYFPLIRHGPHRKRSAQQFLYCCVYSLTVRFITEPFPSKDSGIHIQTHRLMGGIYAVRC